MKEIKYIKNKVQDLVVDLTDEEKGQAIELLIKSKKSKSN